MISSLQIILSEYLYGKMAFHAKALEQCTAAFHHVAAISDNEAVEVRRRRG